jgi:hypothetical protein
MNVRVVFVDWYKTLSTSLFWRQRPGCRLSAAGSARAGSYVLSRADLLQRWMLGWATTSAAWPPEVSVWPLRICWPTSSTAARAPRAHRTPRPESRLLDQHGALEPDPLAHDRRASPGWHPRSEPIPPGCRSGPLRASQPAFRRIPDRNEQPRSAASAAVCNWMDIDPTRTRPDRLTGAHGLPTCSRGAGGHINHFWVSLPCAGGRDRRIGWVLAAELWSHAGEVPARTSA